MFGNGYGFYPGMGYATKKGVLGGIFGKMNLSSILSNTQKTLGIINQAIPIMYQIKPIWNNAKTMFKIAGAIKEDDIDNSNVNTSKSNIDNNVIEKNINIDTYNTSEGPQFFL